MCAVISIWLPIFRTSQFRMPVPFLCQICPSYWYDFPTFVLIWPTPFISIWQSSIGLFLDFLLDYFRTLSYWYDYDQNSPIEMTVHSYWYDGMERGFFYPLLSLNQTVIFLVIDTENLKVIFSKRESSLQGIWPFILGIENTLDLTVNPRPKTLNFLSFQSDRRFVKKTLLKSI